MNTIVPGKDLEFDPWMMRRYTTTYQILLLLNEPTEISPCHAGKVHFEYRMELRNECFHGELHGTKHYLTHRQMPTPSDWCAGV